MHNEIVIKGGYGGRIEVAEGQILEVVNDDGRQICDFFAFNSEDLSETLSPTHTRTTLGRILLEVGDELLSRFRNPMFDLVKDTLGRHDITMSPCDPVVYERRFSKPNHRNCRTNLAEAMEGKGIPYAYLPDPFNLFQDTPLGPDGAYEMRPSPAKPGDKVVLRARMDVIAVGSACPYFAFGLNGDHPTDIRFIVHD